MDATGVCNTAAELVGGDRAATHGNKFKNHQVIAEVWIGYLRAAGLLEAARSLHAGYVANMMVLLKVARTLNGAFNADDYCDAAGYAGVSFECWSVFAHTPDT